MKANSLVGCAIAAVFLDGEDITALGVVDADPLSGVVHCHKQKPEDPPVGLEGNAVRIFTRHGKLTFRLKNNLQASHRKFAEDALGATVTE